jgi:hypothetical protein
VRQVRSVRSVVIVVGIAVAGVLCAAGLAGAHSQSHPTTVTIRGYTFVEKPNLIYGSLDSDTQKCVAGRKVKIYDSTEQGGPYKLTDTATASESGAWSGVVDGSNFFYKALVPKSKYGPKHHRKTCAGDVMTIVVE